MDRPDESGALQRDLHMPEKRPDGNLMELSKCSQWCLQQDKQQQAQTERQEISVNGTSECKETFCYCEGVGHLEFMGFPKRL